MIRKSIIFIVLAIVFISCNNLQKPTEAQCNSVRNGIFYFSAKTKNGVVPFTIYRLENLQKEIQGVDTSFYIANWTSACNYELLLKTTNAKLDAELVQTAKTIPLLCEITTVTDKYFCFTAERKANKFYLQDTMWLQPSY